MSISSLLNTVVDIQTETESKSAMGGTSKTWTTTNTGISAKVDPISSEASAAYGRMGWDATDHVFFDSDWGLAPNVNRIVFNGDQFLIRGVYAYAGGSLAYWKAVCLRRPLNAT